MQTKIRDWFKNNWFRIVAILFLLGSFGDNPYSYYQFLRWIILAIGAYSAYLAYDAGKKIWAWIFGIIAVLFNPIVPFYMQRETWQSIDVLVTMIFFTSLFTTYARKN